MNDTIKSFIIFGLLCAATGAGAALIVAGFVRLSWSLFA